MNVYLILHTDTLCKTKENSQVIQREILKDHCKTLSEKDHIIAIYYHRSGITILFSLLDSHALVQTNLNLSPICKRAWEIQFSSS